MIEIEDIEMYIYWTTCALRSKAASSPGHTHLAIFLSDKKMNKLNVNEGCAILRSIVNHNLNFLTRC